MPAAAHGSAGTYPHRAGHRTSPVTATPGLPPDAAPAGGLLARRRIAIARFGTDVAAAGGIGPALAGGLDPADYPVVPGGVPQAWERAQVYLGLCERYQELYQAQVTELHLLMTTVPGCSLPLPHRRALTDPFGPSTRRGRTGPRQPGRPQRARQRHSEPDRVQHAAELLAEQVQHHPLSVALLTRAARRQLAASLNGSGIRQHGRPGNASIGAAGTLSGCRPWSPSHSLTIFPSGPGHRRTSRTRTDTYRLDDAVTMAAGLHTARRAGALTGRADRRWPLRELPASQPESAAGRSGLRLPLLAIRRRRAARRAV